MAKTLFSTLLLCFTFAAHSAVVSSKDQQNNCTLFRVTTETSARENNETIILDRDVYGISLIDLDIDFNNREAQVQLTASVVMGLNRSLGRVRIPENHPDFKLLVNQVNRKIFLLERACVDRNNVLVYAKAFETSDDR